MEHIFLILGMIMALVGFLWVVVIAFNESLLWGLGSLIIPIVGVAFALLNFSRAGKPLIIWVVGMALIIGA